MFSIKSSIKYSNSTIASINNFFQVQEPLINIITWYAFSNTLSTFNYSMVYTILFSANVRLFIVIKQIKIGIEYIYLYSDRNSAIMIIALTAVQFV